MTRLQSKKNWAETLAAFEDYLHRRGRAQNSILAYRATLKDFGKFYRDELKKIGPYVSRLQETDFHMYIDYLRSTRYLAASSINRTTAALRAFSIFALEHRLHKRDIAQDLKTFFIAPSKAPRLEKKEIRRIISAIDLNKKNGFRDLAIVQLLLQCGLRINEISNITMGDIQINKTNGNIRIRDDKTSSDRMIPLNASIRNAINKYLPIRGDAKRNEPLFLSQKGNRISVKRVQYLVKHYLCAADRSDLSGCDLRHHFARRVFTQSKELVIVQKLLGHRNIATTARYVQPTEEEIANILEKLPENIYDNDSK